MRSLPFSVSLLLSLSMMACQAGDDGEPGPERLTEEEVTSIPEGDAAGTWASGVYVTRTRTVACSGLCRLDTSIGTIDLCEEGEEREHRSELVQEGGRLGVRVDGSDVMPEYQGGLDDDGAFDVGGAHESGDLRYLARVVGDLDEAGTLAGTLTIRADGEPDGSVVRCTAEYDVEGERIDRD
jgi:hypothetical protein